MDRRSFVAGLMAPMLAPGAALAQRSDLRSVAVAVQGRLSARTIGRFVQLLRQNLGRTVYLDLVGEEAQEPGGLFDLGEGQGPGLVIEHRGGRRLETVRIEENYTRIGRDPARYAIKGHFDCIVDRTDGDPNLIRLLRTPNMALDRGTNHPTVRL